jgi:superfamily II DNA helicase RecQ
MKLKVFHIRLTKENLYPDQEKINIFLENVSVKKTSATLIQGNPNFWSVLVFYNDKKVEIQNKKTEKISIPDESCLSDEEMIIYCTLKEWRNDMAKTLNIPHFIICHNAELITIAKVKPRTMEELQTIKGFGETKIAKFGEDILALLNSI